MSLPRQCLSHLHAHGETNTRDLAQVAGVKTSRVTTAMNRLCRSGFVRRVRREVVGEGKQAANVCVWRALRPLSELRSGPPPATTRRVSHEIAKQASAVRNDKIGRKGLESDKEALKRGLLYPTEADAIAAAMAMIGWEDDSE